MLSVSDQDKHEPSFWEKLRFMGSLYALTLLPHDPITRPHWNEILPGLILGGLPLETSLWGHGNHGNKLLNQCIKSKRPLSLVVSAMEGWELEGKGIGLKPVSGVFWQKHGVTCHHLNMQDFTGDVDVRAIKEQVDAIHRVRQQGKSAYVHCKAGRGRSYLVVFCYLMLHEGIAPNQVLETIYQARSQVSPSGRQFATIETFRAQFCPQLKPINHDSDGFYPYRKDILSFASSSKIQGTLVSILSYAIGTFGIGTSLLAGIAIKKSSEYLQNWRTDYQNNQYLELLARAEQNLRLERPQVGAFNSGFDAANSWQGWFRAWLHGASYYRQYGAFVAGVKAGKEHQDELREAINASVRVKRDRHQ